MGEKGREDRLKMYLKSPLSDEIFLCTETPQKQQHLLQELSDESKRMCIKMNIAKTKVMIVGNTLHC